MPQRKPASPKVSAKGSAKLEAVAKATYTRKRIIRETVPAEVTRAKAGAWLDLLSPITEWAGLKGDELRYKRNQLRLQREDVLTEIVKKGLEILRQRPDGVVHQVPTKFLVPFLEQASLEDLGTSLSDMWVNLLVSATEEFSSYHTHFVSVISRLAPKQGEIFKHFVQGIGDLHEWELALDEIDNFRSHRINRFMADEIQDCRFKAAGINTNTKWSDEDVVDCILEKMENNPGVVGVFGAVSEQYPFGLGLYDIFVNHSPYKDDDEIDYEILEAIGLIRRVNTGGFDINGWTVHLIYYHLTTLGFYFTKACRIIGERVSSDLRGRR
jgi:hypothetical protein